MNQLRKDEQNLSSGCLMKIKKPWGKISRKMSLFPVLFSFCYCGKYFCHYGKYLPLCARDVACSLPPGPRSPRLHVAHGVRLGTLSEGPERPGVHQSVQNLGFISIISQQPLSVIICLAGRLQRVVFERSAGMEPAAWKFPGALASQFSCCFHGFSFTLSKFSVRFFLTLLGIRTTVADGGSRSHPIFSGFTASCHVGTVHRVRS